MDCALSSVFSHCVGRADVGLRGAGADCDAEADARYLRRRPGHELGLRTGVLEHLLRDHAGVERVAARGMLDELGRGAEKERELVAGGTLEARASSRIGPVISPPARIVSSAACMSTLDNEVSAKASIVAKVKEDICMIVPD